MSKGVVVFAFKNEKIDYVSQAKFLAQRVTKFLNLPTTIVTDENIKNNVFDKVILLEKPNRQIKKFTNFQESENLTWYNCARHHSYDITPYEKTLVLDSDYVISNDLLLNCFETDDIMMYSNNTIFLNNPKPMHNYFSNTGPKMYWATCLYFTKNKESEIFFNLTKHILENYKFYSLIYDFSDSPIRNDFIFSIATHMFNNLHKGTFVKDCPGKHYILDANDLLLDINDDMISYLAFDSYNDLHKPVVSKGLSVHVMNKYSFDKFIAGTDNG